MKPTRFWMTDKFGRTELHLAILENNLDKVQTITRVKPELINKYTKKSYTPLYLACELGFREIAELLIKHGAACICDNFCNTYLHAACYNLRTDCVELILKKFSFLINYENRWGETALFSVSKRLWDDAVIAENCGQRSETALTRTLLLQTPVSFCNTKWRKNNQDNINKATDIIKLLCENSINLDKIVALPSPVNHPLCYLFYVGALDAIYSFLSFAGTSSATKVREDGDISALKIGGLVESGIAFRYPYIKKLETIIELFKYIFEKDHISVAILLLEIRSIRKIICEKEWCSKISDSMIFNLYSADFLINVDISGLEGHLTKDILEKVPTDHPQFNNAQFQLAHLHLNNRDRWDAIDAFMKIEEFDLASKLINEQLEIPFNDEGITITSSSFGQFVKKIIDLRK